MARSGMLFNWIDEELTPDLSLTDRMILVLFTFGISRKDQLAAVTKWTKNQVDGTLKRIRKQAGTTAKDKDAWLRYWQIKVGKPFIYSLGKKGNEHARLIREEYAERNSTAPLKKAQINHFLGNNDILCRMLQAGLPVEDWMAGKEIQSVLYHEGLERKYTSKGVEKTDQRVDLRPDGWVEIAGEEYFVEYDNATKSPIRLKEQLKNYLDYSYQTEQEITPVVWVVPNQKRKDLIEQLGKEVLEEMDQYQEIAIPTMYCFLPGEEVGHFSGTKKAKPFWTE